MVASNNIYKSLYTTDKRYVLITGGRGSGKSFEVAVFLALLTYEANQHILFTRYTLTSAYKSIIPEFKAKIELLGLQKVFKITRNEITNKLTGNSIIFSGIKSSSGNQTANLKSVPATTFVVDEAEEFVDYDTFSAIDLSIRALNAQNTIVLIMNPSNREHWVYQKFIQHTSEVRYIDGTPLEVSTHPNVLHIHTTYLDNLHNLNQSFIDTMEEHKANNIDYYKHIALGTWLDIGEGSLFQTINTYKHSELMNKEGVTLAFIDVADTGNDYLCCVIARVINTTIYIVDVVFSNSSADITLPQCALALTRNNVRYCQVESNSMGSMYASDLAKLAVNTQVLRKHEQSNKHTRIINDSFYISQRFLFLDESERDAQYVQYIKQLRSYTKDGKAKHDDAPDATSGVWRFIKAQIQGF
jgi:phage terminase large subunit